MAFSSNPKLPTDGLVLLLDAADITSARTLKEVEVMVVGGGGGGGMDMGGGGGGGGVIYRPNVAVSPGVGVTVTVGAGGWGAPAGSGGYRGDGAGPQPGGHQFTIPATNGGSSAFGNIVALGGGYGGSSYFGYTPDYGIGSTGASGGGNSGYTAGNTTTAPNGTVGQGYKGGNAGGGSYYSGGGGGAGGPGTDGPNTPHGGPGIIIPRMSPYYYGGGGGGASYSSGQGGNGGIGGGGGGANGTTYGGAGINNGQPGGGGGGGQWANTPGGNAGANTGGGGGGGAHYNANNQGGNGGSGIVIVRYNGPQAATGGTYSFENGVSFHTFTSSGTFTPYNSATVWYDSSGNNNHAVLSNAPTWNSQGYFTFDGTNNYGVITNNSTLNFQTGQTLIIVMRHTYTSGRRNPWNQAYAGYGTWTHEQGDYISAYFGDGGGDNSPYIGPGSAGTPRGVWNMMVATRSTTTHKWFINGSLSATTGHGYDTLTATSANITIGNGYAGYWVGDIAYIAAYNRALTDSEVARVHAILRSRFGI